MKITIIGAGHVGVSITYALILREFADELVLIDKSDEILIARELELEQSIASFNLDINLICTQDYSYTKNSDIVIFCAGLARQEGQSRQELLQINTEIMLSCAKNIKKYVEDPLFIILTNPVDFLLNTLYEHKIFSTKKIIAMAGILDNARFKYELSKKLRVKMSNIDTRLIGFHNDDMVLLKSYARINNKPLSEFLNEEGFEYIENEVKTGGAKIIRHLKSSAYLAPAAACVRMLEATRSGEFLPISVILNGELGVKNKAFGVMARLGLEGVIEIMKLDLSQDETDKLEKSLIKYHYKGE
ncbi:MULTISPECIES: lactate/malate family dehydrogenase [unclassified Campylobacter]|uniref:lactate/malate family dehydrogenase n=1 Tax=unclassified Campylobacter TaxID=2593542 RepID=UPI0012380E2A|nr:MULTISPECIES: malate dehydrogenase [unclassified Campylobacter]KAA6225516.1 malate dehydrogenase [Campylobacter sp. LR196d]KAA6226953.1 malate dehydrogenase [Campylobacter sp. LR185c]KAA6229787.1 malate dehydrogenase [Campylobacter sp. LR286c]KAA6234531.1 malate dehydrogenase [Campylobacter sp. LR264d]KAA8604078.1 malate dehydrogenase [Campylobacter sp. LR185c]